MGLDIKPETEREVIVPAPQVPEPVPQQEPAPTWPRSTSRWSPLGPRPRLLVRALRVRPPGDRPPLHGTYSDGLRTGLVLGAVLLWGRMMVGEVNADKRLPEPGLRYRAEYGQVLAIRKEDEWSYGVSEKFGIHRAAESYLPSELIAPRRG